LADPIAIRGIEVDVATVTEAPSFEGWVCPLPLRDSPTIVMGHGGGGAMSGELVEHVFLPSFGDATLEQLGDSAVVEVGDGRLAFSTDSFVVRPLFFPGGSIGDLAVNGTVNDLAMSGAQPLFLSAAFILEEGTDVTQVGAVAKRLGEAARRAGVRVVTGDTKVVESGHGDGVYINTAGIGVVPDGTEIRPDNARPGDVVIVSGDIGVHGVAIMSVREGLQFGADVLSDSQPLNGLVDAMLSATRDVHVLRDPTRGGVATSLNEIARASKVGITLDEQALPIPDVVSNACAFLGLDPLQVANEGKLLAFVARDAADEALAAMRAHPAGAGAAIIGECVEAHPGMVSARTGFGASRVVDLPIGEQLPRIC
jgi:hydrogenase expression/formation protein HypE